MTDDQVENFILYLCLGYSISMSLSKAGIDYNEYYKKKWNKDERISVYLERYKERRVESMRRVRK